jgi:hypothetical protein
VASLRFTAREPLGAQTALTLGLGASLTLHATWGGSFSATLSRPLTRRAQLEVSAIDNVYAIDRVLQHDLMASAGLALQLDSGEGNKPPHGALSYVARRITITPEFGAYLSLVPQGHWSPPSRPVTVIGLRRVTLGAGRSMGVKVVVRGDHWLGLEASVATAPRMRRLEWWRGVWGPGDSVVQTAPRIEYAAAHSTVTAIRLSGRRRLGTYCDLTLGVGPAIVQFSGTWPEWDWQARLKEGTFVGASISANLSIMAAPGARFEFGLVDNLYTAEFGVLSLALGDASFLQHDLVISLGIAVTPHLFDGSP